MADRAGADGLGVSAVSEVIDKTDTARLVAGYLSLTGMLALYGASNRILDPFSVLISQDIQIGTGNTFYPGTILRSDAGAGIVIGDDNVFWPGCVIEAVTGPVTIGNGNQFGDGGFTAKANQPGACITVGDRGRYMGNPSVFGKTDLQSGSQILGAITVMSCKLSAGGSHDEPEPDARAGLLKGFGVAKGLTVHRGQVILGNGSFQEEDAVSQSTFHPR